MRASREAPNIIQVICEIVCWEVSSCFVKGSWKQIKSNKEKLWTTPSLDRQARSQIRHGVSSWRFGPRVHAMCLFSSSSVPGHHICRKEPAVSSWHLSFYKFRVKVPNNLGTHFRLQLCLKTMRETLFSCLEAEIGERGWLWTISLLSIRDGIVTYNNHFNKELEWLRWHFAHPVSDRSDLRLNLLSMSELVLLIAVSFGPAQMGFFKAISSSGWPLN